MSAVTELITKTPIGRACAALSVPRGSYYRTLAEPEPRPDPKPRPKPAWTLSKQERRNVLDVLNSEEFADVTPYTVYATLLDRDEWLCSVSTMYRILEENGEVRERRNQLRHPKRVKPVLKATAPNQVWTWDITKLRGPQKGVFYYLYTVLDIYSRKVVGWMLAEQECKDLACQLIAETCQKEGITRDALTIHSDRGGPMTANSMAQLLVDLGVAKSHSRPRVPDDNPFSEAHFKTMKYQPDFPGSFSGFEDTHAYSKRFIHWYNEIHYHSGIAFMTPATLHAGQAQSVQAQRQETLDQAYAANPDRFVHGPPTAAMPPSEVWINQPALEVAAPAEHATEDDRQPEDGPTVARDAPAQASSPDAQAGSTAAEGRAQRSVDADEHPATAAEETSIIPNLPAKQPAIAQ